MDAEYWLKKPTIEALKRINTTALALDIGANIGNWSNFLCPIFDNVIAVEPDHRAYHKISPKANLQILNMAVAEVTGIKTLFKRQMSGQNSLLEKHPIGDGNQSDLPYIEKQTVECISMDDLAKDGADFVKIDIEGAEILALQGCQNLNSWKRTTFLIECHDTYEEVEKQLFRLDKKITKIKHPLSGAHPGHCWIIAENTGRIS